MTLAYDNNNDQGRPVDHLCDIECGPSFVVVCGPQSNGPHLTSHTTPSVIIVIEVLKRCSSSSGVTIICVCVKRNIVAL